MTVVTAACSVPGIQSTPQVVGGGPQVTLSNPTPGQVYPAGSEVKVQSTSVDPDGVARVELLVNGEVVRIDANAHPEANTPFIVAQPWTPPAPGSFVVQVRVYDTANAATETAPLVVEIGSASQVAGPPPTPTPLPSPSPVPAVETATPLPLPADSPTPAAASPEPEVEHEEEDTPSPTPTRYVPLETPTATPTPGQFEPAGFEPQERFYEIWEEVGGGRSRLGYPTGPEITGQNYAKQYFERGLMVWWDNPDGADAIWVIDSPRPDLNSGLTWNRYVDTWAGDDPFACDEARQNGELGPMRGFGQLWCDRPELRQRLGRPWEREAGSAGNPPFSQVQFFQGGVMLSNPINAEVYVLFDQGDWLRFGE